MQNFGVQRKPGFHMIATIAMIAAIAELFFSAIAAIVAIIWKPGLRCIKGNVEVAYGSFKRRKRNVSGV